MTTLEDRIATAFEGLRASEDTYTEVMMRIGDEKDWHRKRTSWKIALALVGLLAGGTTAAALVGGGFLTSAFGDKGQDDVPVRVVTKEDTGATYQLPAMEWTGVSDEEAAELIGDAAQHVGASVANGDLTVSIDDAVFDENGLCVATITVACPDGVAGWNEAGYGVVYPGPDAQVMGIDLYGAQAANSDVEANRWDSRLVIDRERSTATELHLVQYGVPFDRTLADSTVVWRVRWGDGDGQNESEVFTEPFSPSERLTAVTLVNDDGRTAWVSPLGLVFDGPIGEGKEPSWVIHDIELGMREGDPLVIRRGNEVRNVLTEAITHDGGMECLFNRLVDVGQVASVTINGPDGMPIIFEMSTDKSL